MLTKYNFPSKVWKLSSVGSTLQNFTRGTVDAKGDCHVKKKLLHSFKTFIVYILNLLLVDIILTLNLLQIILQSQILHLRQYMFTSVQDTFDHIFNIILYWIIGYVHLWPPNEIHLIFLTITVYAMVIC